MEKETHNKFMKIFVGFIFVVILSLFFKFINDKPICNTVTCYKDGMEIYSEVVCGSEMFFETVTDNMTVCRNIQKYQVCLNNVECFLN